MAIGGHSSIYQLGETGPLMTQSANFQPYGEWGIGSTAGILPPGTTPSLINLEKLWDPNMQVPGGTTQWTVPMMIVDNFAFAIEASTTGAGDITWSVSASANTPDGKTNTWAFGPTSGTFVFGSNGAMGGSFAPNNIIQNGATPGNYVEKLLLPDNGANYIGVAGWNPGNPPAQGPVGGNGGNPYLFKRGTWNLSFTNDFTPAAINQHFTQLPAAFTTFATPRRVNINPTIPASFGAWPPYIIDQRNLSAASNSWSISNVPLRATGLWDLSFTWAIVGITAAGDYSQGVSGDLLHLSVTGACVETIGSGY